ncbi:MAG: methyltransferase domain-containing protein [Proteobacteria bacterium]|nr:methyltransferase domain-containing protein [Pseudomonadota bacterium]MBU1686169.1 methyltransferase domain-containing protein [Pseudomonadota bacterium]
MNAPLTVPTQPDSSYTAASITVLSGLEAVRRNPGMYIGSTGIDGLHHLVYELVDNAIDESRAGFCSQITVTLTEDGSCTVEDNGRGIPVELHPTEKLPACQVVLTRLHAGGKFAKTAYQYTAGLHGVGLSCLNALSAELTLDIRRDGGHYRQLYGAGLALNDLKSLGTTTATGTRITFRPDPAIFAADLHFSYQTLAGRLRELAFLHPRLLIKIVDLRNGRHDDFQYSSGLSGYLEYLRGEARPLHPKPINLSWHGPDYELEIGLLWTTGYNSHLVSFVNSINTGAGGTHVDGLKTALTRTINTCAEEQQMLHTDNGERISSFDILEGLVGVVSVQMAAPQFEGQTKTRITNPELTKHVDEVVGGQLLKILHSDPKLTRQVVGRSLAANRSRMAARRAGERIALHHFGDGIDKEIYQKQFGVRSKNWHQSAAWIANDELLAEHARHLQLKNSPLLLDVCCGSGVVGAAFGNRVGKKIGLDITPEMLAMARTRLDQVIQGTVYQIPIPDESVDLVVNREVLHLLPGPEKPVSEIHRVLKPGGQFIVGQILPYGPADSAWMYRIFKKKQPLIYNMFLEEDFRELLLGAGFIDLTMTEYRLWESIDVWIDTHETTSLHRHEIRELFHNAPREVREIHPFEILPSGEIRDCWRWCVFSVRKPS